jgi:hypothetical protein
MHLVAVVAAVTMVSVFAADITAVTRVLTAVSTFRCFFFDFFVRHDV